MFRRLGYWLWRVLPMPLFLRYLLMWVTNQKFLVGVVAVILNDQGEVLLFRHTYRKDTPWGLPSGYLKRGEVPDEALEREIMEESGLKVRIIKPLSVEGLADFPRLDLVFRGEMVGDFQFAASVEVGEARFFPTDDLPRIIADQKRIIEKCVGK